MDERAPRLVRLGPEHVAAAKLAAAVIHNGRMPRMTAADRARAVAALRAIAGEFARADADRSGPSVGRARELGFELRELELPVRVADRLRALGMRRVGDLCAYAPRELLALPGVGERSLADVQAALSGLGLSLAVDVGRPGPRTPAR